MNIIFHRNYFNVYSSDPATAPGRIESIMKELNAFKVVEPEVATDGDVALVHGKSHIEYIESMPIIYEVALLGVGGAVKASEIAMEGEPAFGVIRPPGHHASQNSCWGFCYFNNVAVSIERIAKAIILDIDLHYGDGTANIFSGSPNVLYHHIADGSRENFFEDLKECLGSVSSCDIVAVSAGFDRHERDWGGVLSTDDYFQTADIIKNFAQRVCGGRRYAVLEGGYNHKVLGKNVKAFIEGFG
ncbi:MAG: histone deacetylase family protein [Candidatus Bathycorpusculaceae bacterium]